MNAYIKSFLLNCQVRAMDLLLTAVRLHSVRVLVLNKLSTSI